MMDVESDSAFANTKEARNYVKFYRQWMRNNFKSKEQGIEVGEHQDFIIIICPGNPKSEVRRKATDNDKAQYRQEWQAYSEGKEYQLSGTPIEMLPGLASGMADGLKALYIYTIEQMAELSDMALQKVGMGANDIRQRCKAYLSKNSTEVTALNAQLAETNAKLQEALEAIAKLQEAKTERKKPGPKPKLKMVA
jgi:hypothetical protein